MIYLIDDKTSRQRDYGWDFERFAEFDNLSVINSIKDLIDKLSEIFSSSDNIILFHESFLNSSLIEDHKAIDKFKTELIAHEGINPVAYFSGSINSRWLSDDGKICMLSPDELYNNLTVFVNQCLKRIIDFRYLLFGENLEVEASIRSRLEAITNHNWKKESVTIKEKVFYAFTNNYICDCHFNNAEINRDWDFFDKNVTDKELDELTKEWFSNEEYDAIFIPLCFGHTLSDYMGLRLAMHIRLTATSCRYKHIFIYGEESINDISHNTCFDILKSTGVSLIRCDYDSMMHALSYRKPLTEEIFVKELNRIHIEIPTNIGDNHSVTNKWGIYRWSLVLDGDDDEINKNNEDIYCSLYFKYLTALYPPSRTQQIKEDDLRIKDGRIDEAIMPQLNILYVDDEADEGWYELLCQIIYDINNIKDFEHIGRELKNMTVDEIVNHVMNKITESNINVVILDLRLHSSDFNEANIRNITGYKLLEKIKHHNRGIQVLMFSATNKIWNLQALQEKEVDGFVMKEAPENSVDKDYTVHSIIQFTKALSDSTLNTYKIKLWATIQKEKEHISLLRKRKQINAEYAKAIEVLLRMTEDAIFSKDLQYAYATAFMNLFRIIEATSNEWIDPNVVIENAGKESVRSYFKFRKNDSQLLEFSPQKYNPNPQKKLFYYKENPTLSYFQKICNTLHVVGAYNINAFNIVIKRNNFTHPNLIENSEIEKFSVCDVLSVFDLVEQLIMNQ